jgi:hypothetical protein
MSNPSCAASTAWACCPCSPPKQMVTAMSANWQRFCNQMNKAA